MQGWRVSGPHGTRVDGKRQYNPSHQHLISVPEWLVRKNVAPASTTTAYSVA